MKSIKILIALSLLLMINLSSCTDAQRAKTEGFGSNFKIEMIGCDGTVVRSWISSGKVMSESNSDGYFFKDEKTGALIEVTGNLVITKL